jgi:hypothetical protein
MRSETAALGDRPFGRGNGRFYQRKREDEELDRELLLAQITLEVETLEKIVCLSGLSVVPSKLARRSRT